METVLISGANGFIARLAAQRLREAGFRILGLSRSPSDLAPYDAVFLGRLKEPLGDVLNQNIDTFVHCAYHTGANDFSVNVEGTKQWAVQAEKEGVRHQIFLSSVSAIKNSLSSYARAKYVLEQWFMARGHVVLRLGLVIGPGGLFQRMARWIKRYPLLPLPDGGHTPVFVLGIEDVCQILLKAVQRKEVLGGRIWNLFQPTPITLQEILEEIRGQQRTFCLFVPVSSILLLQLVRILKGLYPAKMRMVRNNLIGLQQDAVFSGSPDFSVFDLPVAPLAELVQQAL